MNGQGVRADTRQAIKFLRLAADQGNIAGMYIYAQCLETGKGVSKNLRLALGFYEQAADKGHALAREAYARLAT
jgi:TPR repeat protein